MTKCGFSNFWSAMHSAFRSDIQLNVWNNKLQTSCEICVTVTIQTNDPKRTRMNKQAKFYALQSHRLTNTFKDIDTISMLLNSWEAYRNQFSALLMMWWRHNYKGIDFIRWPSLHFGMICKLICIHFTWTPRHLPKQN